MIYKLPIYFEIADTDPEFVPIFVDSYLRKLVEDLVEEHLDKRFYPLMVERYQDKGIHSVKFVTKNSVMRKFVSQAKKANKK